MSEAGFCDVCGGARVFKSGQSAKGPWKGWFCPKGKACEGKPVWIKDEQQAPQRQAQAPQAPAPRVDARERSIAAQACCKAACEAAAGNAHLFTGRDECADWIVVLANRLMLAVVIAHSEGRPVVQQPAPAGPDSDIPF